MKRETFCVIYTAHTQTGTWSWGTTVRLDSNREDVKHVSDSSNTVEVNVRNKVILQKLWKQENALSQSIKWMLVFRDERLLSLFRRQCVNKERTVYYT